jgi:hypothetical protein
MNMNEKFFEADVYGNNENSILVDEGYFINSHGDKVFTSILTNETCSCNSREIHESHLRFAVKEEEDLKHSRKRTKGFLF